MIKVLRLAAFYLSILFFFQNCSSSDDNSSNLIVPNNAFSVNNQSYTLLPSNGIVELRMNDFDIDGQLYDRSSITISGMSGLTVATVSFDLYYKDGLPVEGVYSIDETMDSDSDFSTNLSATQRLCSGWTSICSVTQFGGGLNINANNPTGTVEVINNGNNNYTIKYSNTYRKYDNFQVIGNVPVAVNITSNVIIQ